MIHPTTATDRRLDWLLNDLIKRVPGARHAVVLSQDGLVISRSETFGRDRAEQLAAASSGLSSLARSIGRSLDGGPVRQTLIEMENAFLFLTTAGRGTHLVVLTDQHADVGVVAFEMNTLVRQVGEYLSTSPRSAPEGVQPGGVPA